MGAEVSVAPRGVAEPSYNIHSVHPFSLSLGSLKILILSRLQWTTANLKKKSLFDLPNRFLGYWTVIKGENVNILKDNCTF